MCDAVAALSVARNIHSAGLNQTTLLCRGCFHVVFCGSGGFDPDGTW